MVEASQALIVIPTYNEKENVEELVHRIFSVEPAINLLFVDDNSPDGTAQIIQKLKENHPTIHLLNRSGKLGLGTAYIAGFKYALENKFEYIFEMDADFSHDAREIPNFLAAMENNDLVLGSRYIRGVNVINWPLKRLLISYYANAYTRLVTGVPIRDCTGGFKCFRREVLATVDLNQVKSNGYGFQIEMNVRAWRKNFRVLEIPIIFVDRIYGESKLSTKIMWEAIFLVWKLRFLHLIGKL